MGAALVSAQALGAATGYLLQALGVPADVPQAAKVVAVRDHSMCSATSQELQHARMGGPGGLGVRLSTCSLATHLLTLVLSSGCSLSTLGAWEPPTAPVLLHLSGCCLG